MEESPNKRAERRPEPELQIVPLDRHEIERESTMPPDMTSADIGEVLKRQQQKDEKKRKKMLRLNS